MTCKHPFRTDSPHKVLRALYNEQRKSNPTPENDDEFIKVRSGQLIQLAGLPLTSTSIYNILDKLCVNGLLSVHSDPGHKQAYRFSLTHQSIRCQLCYRYQEGIEPAPETFKCGSISVDA